ncbi:MAG TPA: SCO family protein [Methylibium sp.]|uniref:SCO family protein n=1 Tax=Methylibium sp. TaxID=2067992 RepID=UPI002DBD068B|nr:SCO family protein [Methylibium sp.]HEU4457970.1 SCO family protein [Methylibium sp.]
MTDRRHLLLATTSLFVLAACGESGSGAAAPAGGFKGVDITGADYAKGFSLPDAQGKPRTLDEFKGKAVVVFFGYTQCPDVCPTTMAELAAAKKQLGADGDKLAAVFVTVDPERDTPEILRAYMSGFDPAFVALRGSVDETLALAKSYKAFFQKVQGKDPANYTMDHTAGAYVYDPAGRVRLFVRYGQPVDAWVADLKYLIAG